MPDNPRIGNRVKVSVAAAVALAVLATAASASAGTASLQVVPGPCDIVCSKYAGMPPPDANFRFDANAAEANKLTLAVTPQGTTVTVTDTGAPLTAGANCTRVDDHTVMCTSSAVLTEYDVKLGNGGDTFTAATSLGTTALVNVHGGTGNDTLTGNDEADFIDGGGGSDRISGGGGGDFISDGDPTTGGDGDVIDGGPGNDTVDYSNRTVGVNVDLSAGTGPDGDKLTGIEDAGGGSGNDTITGDAGPNMLDGGPGNDRLFGGAGDDTLNGGPGRDLLSGGPGNDELQTRDGMSDSVTCGPGRDVVRDTKQGSPDPEYGQTMPYDVGPDPTDVLAADCERVVLDAGRDNDGTVARAQPLTRTSRTLVFAPPCRCRGRLDVTSPGGGVGSAHFTTHTRRIAVHARRALPRVVELQWHAGRHSGGWSLAL